MHHYTLPRLQATVVKQPLPGGKPRHYKSRAHSEVNIGWQRRKVTCLDSYILSQGAVTVPIGETEHALPD
jgi:hypothetical protein